MTGNITFSMIKPDAYADGHTGAILKIIEDNGYKILALKLIHMTESIAGKFYEVHKERPFYGELKAYMSKGPIVAFVLQKDDAVASFRKLIGATDPAKADDGTIRKMFARSLESNAIHGSDSDENALREASFFFSAFEQY